MVVVVVVYRSACVSRHLQLRTGGFFVAKFYCPHALADSIQHIQIREKMLEFSSTVIYTVSVSPTLILKTAT